MEGLKRRERERGIKGGGGGGEQYSAVSNVNRLTYSKALFYTGFLSWFETSSALLKGLSCTALSRPVQPTCFSYRVHDHKRHIRYELACCINYSCVQRKTVALNI